MPALLVRDMADTLAFYRTLGFRRTGGGPRGAEGDDELTWTEVQRDGITIQLRTEAPHGTPAEPSFSGTLYLFPESVLALADELRGRIDFAWGPEVMPYAMLEFAVQDPNGYYLAFTEPA